MIKKIKGYTIRNLTSGSLFKNHIHVVVEPKYNETNINFCTKERYENCCNEERCNMCKPKCRNDETNFLKLPYGSEITLKHEKRIKDKLKRIWKSCKPVEITIRRTK